MYVLKSDITSRVPGVFLTQALDDDSDGIADAGVWDSIAVSAGDAVDGLLGGRFHIPFAEPLPPIVTNAAQVFALEILYQRRGISPEQNPWAKQADDMRAMLRQIAKGAIPLAPDKKAANRPGTIIAEPSKTHDRQGRRM